MASAIRLLYVDDEPTLLEIGKIFLEAKGEYVVDTLASAKEALLRLKSERYDAIVSDYQMPEMDGITFLKQLKASGNATPFIIFTGRGREEIVIQALNEGADFYLQKGGEPRSQFAELAHKIHQAVQQRAAAASIRDLERREADIIDFLPDATLAIDTRGVVIAWNRAMEQMTGVKADQILGKGNYEYAIPFYHERRPIFIDLVFKDDPAITKKYPAITRDGTTLYSEITIPHFNNGRGAALWFTASPLFDRKGIIVGAIESIRDITERKRAEEALHESEKRFRELSDLLPQIVYEADRNGNLTYANRIAFEQYGYSEEEFRQGLNILQMVAPNNRERATVAFQAIFEGKRRTGPVDEYQAMRKDGSTFPVSIYSSPIFSNNGIVGIRGIIVDISERKRNEKALADGGGRLLRAELVAGLGHWEFDLETREVYASDGGRSLYGLSTHTSTIPEVQKIPLSEYRPMLDEALRALVEDNRSYDVEFRIRRPSDGKFLDIHSIAEYDPTKKVVFGVIQDITERKRQDHILKTQLDLGLALQSIRGLKETLETCLNGAIEISGMDAGGIYLINGSDGSIDLIVSRNLGDDFVKNASHYPEGSANARMVMAGKPIYMPYGKTGIVHTPVQAQEGLMASAIMPVLSKGRVIACLNISSHSEDEIPANARVALETIATQIGTAIERIRADEALAESEERYRNIVEDQTEFISRFLPDGTHVFVNDAYCRYFGLNREEILGHRFRPDIPAEDKEHMKRFFASLTPDHPVDTIRHRIIMPDGRIRWQRWSDRAIFDTSGKVTEYQSVGRDISEEKEAEIALLASEERYRTLAETSNDIIFVISSDDRVEYVNSFAAAMLKKPVEQILGRPRSTLFPPDLARRQKKALEMVFEKGTPVRNEGVIQVNDQIRWFDHVLMPLKGPDDQVRAVLGISRDITERKRAEDALRESEEKYRTLFDSAGDAIFIHDENGRILAFNTQACEQLGYTRTELMSMTVKQVDSIDNAPHAPARIARLMEQGHLSFETMHRRKDGSLVPTEVNARLITWEGHPAVMSTCRDVTRRKQAEDALRESEQKHRILLDESSDPIFSFYPDGTYRYVNRAFAEGVGKSVDQILGKKIWDVFPKEEAEKRFSALRTAFTTGNGHEFEVRVPRPDGDRYYVTTIVPIKDDKGSVVTVICSSKEITRRKQVEEALRQANKKLNLLSGITRHDIKNQLLALNGFLELLQEKVPDPAYEEYFNRITRISARISAMIDFTREYEEIGVTAPVWQDCRTLIDTTAKVAPLGKIMVKNDIPAGTEVFADPLIAKVFYNLMDNAVRHGKKITTVRFSMEERDGNQIVVCEDDGEGVPEDEKKRIFIRGSGKNTGLGLALSREILDITGISIEETGVPGKGARFEISVPRDRTRFNKE